MDLKPSRKIDYLRKLTLNRIIDQAIRFDMWNGFLVWGEKRMGKSSLALKKARYAWGSWKKVFEHLVFTHEEFLSIFSQYKDKVGQAIDTGSINKAIELRCRAIIWDDISAFLHATTMNYLDKNVMTLINNMTLISQYVANLFITTDDVDKVPSVLFNEVNFVIYATDRGEAIVFYLKKWPKFRGSAGKSYRKLYTLFGITWSGLPSEIELLYRQYRHGHTLELEEIASFRPGEEEDEKFDVGEKEISISSDDDLIDAIEKLLR